MRPIRQTFRRRFLNAITSDAAVAAWIAASMVAVASLAGVYASSKGVFKDEGLPNDRPKPVFMSLKPVHAQMADGDMLSVKVSLQISKAKSPDELTDYAGVFGSLVEKAGQQTSRQDLKAQDGIERFGIDIQRDLNDYLDDQGGTPSRVTSVMFDELVPLPR